LFHPLCTDMPFGNRLKVINFIAMLFSLHIGRERVDDNTAKYLVDDV